MVPVDCRLQLFPRVKPGGKSYSHVTKNTRDMAIYIDHVIGIGKRYWYVTTLSYGFIPLREGRSLLGLALAHLELQWEYSKVESEFTKD